MTTTEKSEQDIAIEFQTPQAIVTVHRHYVRHTAEDWRTWIEIESKVRGLPAYLTVESAEFLIGVLKQAIQEARRITPQETTE